MRNLLRKLYRISLKWQTSAILGAVALVVTIGVNQYVNRVEEKIIPYWTWDEKGEVVSIPFGEPGEVLGSHSGKFEWTEPVTSISSDALIENPVYADLSTITPAESLIIQCGEKGEITIHFSTGQVDLKDCPLPGAAREFWSQVSEAFPEIKATICKEKGESK